MYDPPRILLLKHNMVKHNITVLPPVVCFYVGFKIKYQSVREDELFHSGSFIIAPKKYHDI